MEKLAEIVLYNFHREHILLKLKIKKLLRKIKPKTLRFLSTLWPILQVMAHHIQDKLTVSFDSSSIGLISYKWVLTIYAKYSSVKTYNEEDSIFLEKKYLF